jgi:hypothetical protein
VPAVLFIFVVGIVLGYWLCRMQLRGKFLIAEEMQPLPPSWSPPPPEFAPPPSGPPTIIVECNHTPIKPHRRVLKKFPDNGVEYFSAKQVIGGYDKRGFCIKEPEYPGGIKAWNIDHGWVTESEEV